MRSTDIDGYDFPHGTSNPLAMLAGGLRFFQCAAVAYRFCCVKFRIVLTAFVS
ncbi:hypothetical protein NBRC3293_2647 [Gluconobacter oxydans NBRC 3293]|uniref:Uncharacterized protein n=1 Tax=Gluconobacter oxydans NBRC 3293 TaxID=1315969 RepID=A0A829X5R4_GLUOY|nr:hypothetical protein NBRC3293_2647 [Gluconobacter oxydans NBRC 3293]